MLWQVRAGIASGDRPRPWWTGFEVLWDSMFIVPQVVYIGVAGVWIVSAWKRRSGCAAAFDVVGRDRLTAARFGVLWLLWFVALAVSLPVIGVGSVLIRVEQAVHLWI